MKKIIFLLLLNLLLFSCARVGAPNGGTRDSLAPKFLGSNIDTTRLNVSRTVKELRLDFDEYVMLKDFNKNFNVSPPIKKIKKVIPSNLANKYVLIQWEDTLQANTTYNFNFGNAIVDNNESNPLPYFNFAFSTGDKIDDLFVSGTVKDAMTLIKENQTAKDNKMVVGLYKALSNRITCDDGFSMSVQASKLHYCKPQENKGPYYCVEIGFPNQEEALIAEYAEDIDNLRSTVYDCVPIEIVAQVIQKHSFKQIENDHSSNNRCTIPQC